MTRHLLRTALYVPAANDKAVAKSDSLGADAIIFDLEDSVAPEAKAAARERLSGLPASSILRIIRVNGSDTPWHEPDIAAAVEQLPHALLLPKVNTQEDVWIFKRLITLRKPREPIAVWAMIETAQGVLNAPAIAAALGPDGALVLGLNDLARETGMAQVAGRMPMLPLLSQAVIAARAHGAGVLDGVFNAIGDGEGFEAECRQGKDFGFDGKTVIHPAQIAPANRFFSPSDGEIAAARAIVDAFARPENTGRGVIALGSRMVERLHLEMAQALIAKAAAIAQKGA